MHYLPRSKESKKFNLLYVQLELTQYLVTSVCEYYNTSFEIHRLKLPRGVFEIELKESLQFSKDSNGAKRSLEQTSLHELLKMQNNAI